MNGTLMSPMASEDERVADILSADAFELRLLEHISFLQDSQQPEACASLFERLITQRPITNQWSFARMASAYAALGREDASFLLASSVLATNPTISAAPILAPLVINFYRKRGRIQEALAFFLKHIEKFPDSAKFLSRADLKSMFKAAGSPLVELFSSPGAPEARGRANFTVVPTSMRQSWRPRRSYGGPLPYAVANLSTDNVRPEIVVSCLQEAQVVLVDGQVVVLSADGSIQHDLSVCKVPELILMQLEERKSHIKMEVTDCEEAVIITDQTHAPNLCHYLLDQAPRAGLYESLGVDVSKALVIGPDLKAKFQRRIAATLRLNNYRGVTGFAEIRVRKLWVSTNCNNVRWHADLGATWPLRYIWEKFGGRGTSGTRRLYVSRADARGRRVVNEPEVVELLERYGFQKVVPGTMELDDQIAAFRSASHVVGPHGAAMALTIFSPQQLEFLEFFHPKHSNSAYAMQAQALEMCYSVISGRDGYSNDLAFNDPAAPGAMGFTQRDMRIDIADLKQWLVDTGL